MSLLFCRATGEPNRRTSFDVRAYCSSPAPAFRVARIWTLLYGRGRRGVTFASTIMNPGLRRLTFTTHVTSSLGWFGAVIVFLALAVIAMTSQDERTVRGAYLVMAPAAWFVLVPLVHASLLTGIALSLGTTWGLIRHYWVVLKLGITVFCTAILLIYMGTFRQMAGWQQIPASILRSCETHRRCCTQSSRWCCSWWRHGSASTSRSG